MDFALKILIVVTAYHSAGASALTYSGSVIGGFLQQPTSQYFHAGYGAEVGVANKTESLGIRGIYFERPKFVSQGFEDQDRGYAVLLSSSFWKSGKFRLLGGFGIGRFEGFTRPTADHPTLKGRQFGISGMNVWGELSRDFGPLSFSLLHWVHIGYAGEEQFSAVVAWPFYIYGFAMGWTS